MNSILFRDKGCGFNRDKLHWYSFENSSFWVHLGSTYFVKIKNFLSKVL